MVLRAVPDRHEDGRVVIRTSRARRVDLVDQTIAALSVLEIFQRGGGLVDIVRDPEEGEGGVFIPTGEPRVRVTPFSRVHELCSMACRYEAWRKNAKTKEMELMEVDPPNPVVMTLMERGEWSHIRPLEAMVSWPVLRPDGTVFDGDGYDARTRCYSTVKTELGLPPCITPKHVQQAIATIDDLISDFPFEKPEHRSAWYAALLAVLARPAVKGPVPMVIFDANDRGAGKTCLCDTIGAILTGKKLPRRGIPEAGKDDEWGKMMLGIGIGSYPVVLFDNVNGTLRSSTLDMVLTGEVFQGRVLGLNKEMKVPIRTQFLVSSNNAMISPDLIRRSLHCRIIAQERPELRTGFKHSLPEAAGVPAKRLELLRAAFTILLGYEQAGRPKQHSANPLGSYEAWCERVQAPLVWAGLPDPVTTQAELREQADAEADQLGPMLKAWSALFSGQSITVSAAIRHAQELSDTTRYMVPDKTAVQFMEAISQLGEHGRRATTRQVGYHLRRWKDKWFEQMSFYSDGATEGSTRWGVRSLRKGT